ncbi:MAG: glutathione S-transferase [Litorimonas sp.]
MSAVLYSFRRCPYAMRGRMGLLAGGQDYEHREVLLRDKPAAMIEISPKGTVPIFIKKNGDVIEESLELLLWATKENDPYDWRNVDMHAAQALIARNDGPFKHHLDRYKYKSRYDETAPRGDTDIEHRIAAEDIIKDYEARLSHHNYLLGGHQSLADIAIFPFMRQFANTDRAWWDGQAQDLPPYPRVHDWLERHINSELFKTVMAKCPVWEDPTENTVID